MALTMVFVHHEFLPLILLNVVINKYLELDALLRVFEVELRLKLPSDVTLLHKFGESGRPFFG